MGHDELINQDSGLASTWDSSLNSSTMSLPEHTVKRWKKLIEEGATIQRQILEEPRSKEWTRKSTLLMEDHSVEVQSNKSPTTKLLYKQSRSEKHPYNKRVM